MIWSAKAGAGIVIARLPDETWSAPSCIATGGVGFGLQIGADVSEFVVVLNSDEAVAAFARGGNVTIGGNLFVLFFYASLSKCTDDLVLTSSMRFDPPPSAPFTLLPSLSSAAAGPIGVGGAVATAISLNPAPMFTYSKSKGLFAGVSLEGTALIERVRPLPFFPVRQSLTLCTPSRRTQMPLSMVSNSLRWISSSRSFALLQWRNGADLSLPVRSGKVPPPEAVRSVSFCLFLSYSPSFLTSHSPSCLPSPWPFIALQPPPPSPLPPFLPLPTPHPPSTHLLRPTHPILPSLTSPSARRRPPSTKPSKRPNQSTSQASPTRPTPSQTVLSAVKRRSGRNSERSRDRGRRVGVCLMPRRSSKGAELRFLRPFSLFSPPSVSRLIAV